MARILVVDDDKDILIFAEKVLNHQGHTTFVAADGWTAIELLNRYNFDLLISDANMPHLSGFQLVQTLRSNKKFDNLLIAMLTGLKERKDVERAMQIGVDDYIVKPLDPLILLQKIETLFERRPPAQHPEVSLVPHPQLQNALLSNRVEVLSVSELGISVRCEQLMREGQVVDIDSEFFKQLGVAPPPFKVLNIRETQTNGVYLANLIFLGARENLLQKIRAWILSHASDQKDVA